MSRYAFVAMPFASEYLPIYTELILPVFQEAGWRIDRADEEAHLELITKRVVEKILEADLVVAVLTDCNKNVMYELGVSHTFRKPTLILLSNLEDLPFDLAQLACLEYGDLSGVEFLRGKMKSLIGAYVDSSLPVGNPVTSLVPDPLKFVFPVSPFDVIKVRLEEIEKARKSIKKRRSRIRKMRAIVVRRTAKSENVLDKLYQLLVLGFSYAALVEELWDAFGEIREEAETLLKHSRHLIGKIEELAPYNHELAELRSQAKIAREKLKTARRSYRKGAEEALDSLCRLQESVFFRRAQEYVLAMPDGLGGLLFGSVDRDFIADSPTMRRDLRKVSRKIRKGVRELERIEEKLLARVTHG